MTTHDPREHIRAVHQILISDKKRIGFLFGAGSSFATGLETVRVPAIAAMTKEIIESIGSHSTKFKKALSELEKEIGEGFHVESLLSKVEAKLAVIGSGKLNGLDFVEFTEFGKVVKEKVVDLVSIHDKIEPEDRRKLSHTKLASWVANARRWHPIEIFTTNYDYLFELSLEGCGVPYFDGFSGSFQPFFCPEAVEDLNAYPGLVKLWKMHGSLGWKYRECDKSVVRQQSGEKDPILIYPSHLKYNATKKQPYVGLIDRLCAFLQQDDAVLFTSGYSFSDNHINERIATSLRRGANSHVIALLYDKCWGDGGATSFSLSDSSNSAFRMATEDTAGKMSVYGMRHAVIGGKLGDWRLKTEPNSLESIQVSQYFDEDGAMPSSTEGEGDEVWTGTGEFRLPDFEKLADFLSELSSSDGPSNTL